MAAAILGFLGAGAVCWTILMFLPWDAMTKPPKGVHPGHWPDIAAVAAVVAILAVGVVGASHAVVKVIQDGAQAMEGEATIPTPPAAPKTFEQKRADQLVNDLKYMEFDPIEVKLKDGTTKKYRLFALEAVKRKGIETRDVVLLDKDGESAFSYSLLFDDYAWYKGSTHLFQGPTRKGLPIDEMLQKDVYLRAGLQKAQHVVCIGLSSNELKTMTPEDNEKLSDARGMNLCKALFKISYIVEGTQTAVAACGGYAKDSPPGSDPVRQRTAIVIGVRYGPAFDVEPFVLAINELVNFKGFDLGDYSREPADFLTTDPIEPGPYISIAEVKWEKRTSNQLVPEIPKPPNAPPVEQ